MKKRLALLCFRVARWLAPEYFANRLQSLHEIRMRIAVLRERICEMPAKKLNGSEGRLLVAELQSLEGIYKSVASYGDRYELVKIEIAQTDVLSKAGQQKILSGEKADDVLRNETKRRLFEAMAAGLAQSAEIEKFMYLREIGKIKTVGIEIYLRHKDAKMNVGNYDKSN